MESKLLVIDQGRNEWVLGYVNNKITKVFEMNFFLNVIFNKTKRSFSRAVENKSVHIIIHRKRILRRRNV